MEGAMRFVLGYTAALCVFVVLLCQSIAIPTFSKAFYTSQFKKNDTPRTVSMEMEELQRITWEMLDYMRGRRDDLIIRGTVDGQEREIFNEREKDHMVDVYRLFDIGYRVRNIAFFLFFMIVFIMQLLKYQTAYLMARCLREVLTGFLSLAALLIIIIAVDFNRAFTLFHLIFFNNDLWVLNPATDLLVNIVPQPFFTSISIFIGALAAGFSIACIVCASIYLRKVARFERYPGAALNK
jgi:integral membrane protein (TIGR01906 family)